MNEIKKKPVNEIKKKPVVASEDPLILCLRVASERLEDAKAVLELKKSYEDAIRIGEILRDLDHIKYEHIHRNDDLM